MVSLDNAVLARLEKGGKRYEALVDPDLVKIGKTIPKALIWTNSWPWTKFFMMQEQENDLRKMH